VAGAPGVEAMTPRAEALPTAAEQYWLAREWLRVAAEGLRAPLPETTPELMRAAQHARLRLAFAHLCLAMEARDLARTTRKGTT
jgi:hypothetical protein